MQVNKATMNNLVKVDPYIMYGYPNLKTVRPPLIDSLSFLLTLALSSLTFLTLPSSLFGTFPLPPLRVILAFYLLSGS